MAKQLTGKSKLSEAVQSDTSAPTNTAESPLPLVQKKEPPARGKSLRFRQRDTDKLQKIKDEVNEIATDRIFNDTDIIRGLLELGSKTSAKRLLKAILDGR